MNGEESKGYLEAIADFSGFYIPNALHIERDDNCHPWKYEDDEQATRAAEADGVKLIYGMEDVPDGVYIDTPENREIIRKGLEQYPEYKAVAAEYNEQKRADSPTMGM